MPEDEVIEWTVQRHGGTRRHKWRVLYRGPDEIKAREIYKKAEWDLRQGAVWLSGPNNVREGASGPRLRTRW